MKASLAKPLIIYLALTLSGLVYAQAPPSGDTFVSANKSTTNYGGNASLVVQASGGGNTFIQFNLASIPSNVAASQLNKATLRLFVSGLTTAGNFDVYLINGTWSENTVTYSSAPPLGALVNSAVSVPASAKNGFLEIDVTSALGNWLTTPSQNYGIALVPSSSSSISVTFDSKEAINTSHEPQLIYSFNGPQGPPGPGTVTSVGLSAPSSDFLVSGSPVTSSGTLSLGWNVVPTSANVANAIVKRDSAGSFAAAAVNAGSVVTNYLSSQTSSSTTLVFADNTSTSGNGVGIIGQTEAPGGIGVSGNSTTTAGGFASGVVGQEVSPQGIGVFGRADAFTGNATGVYGLSQSSAGIGVYGYDVSQSLSGSGDCCVGVWGDSGQTGYTGVLGTADDGYAGLFFNNGGYPTLYAINSNASGEMFASYNNATGGYCYIDAAGDLNCSGAKHAVVPIDGGQRKVALAAIESPKNWFEDFGSAQLSGGVATVTLEPDFAQTVNTGLEYHVFLTPNGDCKGLYVSQKTGASFEVHELGGGGSNVGFDYRIVALRKNFENIRLEDRTNDPDPAKMMRSMNKSSAAKANPSPVVIPMARTVVSRRSRNQAAAK